MITKRARKPAQVADPASTVAPKRGRAKAVATPKATEAPLDGTQLDAAILRFLRRYPDQTVDLMPLAEELAVDPYRIQLAVEDLGRRRMVVVPFIEPSPAGGATLTVTGNQWLLDHEGGTPSEKPVALVPATKPVRAADEAARLPRAQVYGVKR